MMKGFGYHGRQKSTCLAWVVVVLMFACSANAQSASESARRALLSEDYPTARTLAAGIESDTERAEFLALVRQCELDSECDVVSVALLSPPPATSLATRLEVLAREGEHESLVSRPRAIALLDLCQALRSHAEPTGAALLARLDAAAAKDAEVLGKIEALRQEARDAIEAARTAISDLASKTQVNALAWRVSDSANNLAALEKRVAEVQAVVAKAEAVFPIAEWLRLKAGSETHSLAEYERAAIAKTRMLYLLRNIAGARDQVEAALSKVPTSRSLLQLKVKIEEWNTRHRIMGDKPN